MVTKTYDLMILGGGLAGMTAGIYSVRYNLKTAIVTKAIGGMGNEAGLVENWPGFVGSGLDLMNNVHKQTLEAGVEFIDGEITSLERDGDNFFVEIGEDRVEARAVIIALGMKHRRLGAKGERELTGKGVSYCATCDGMFFKNKDVLIIGGSDSAAKAALYLAEISKKVYISYRRDEMRCEPILLKRIKEKENIEIKYFTNVIEFKGDKKLEEAILKKEENGNVEELVIPVDGAFIEIGAAPVIEVINSIGVNLDSRGFIMIDRNSKTNVEGIYAAGDNTDSSFKQFVVAAGEGALAAKSAYDYIKFKKKQESKKQ